MLNGFALGGAVLDGAGVTNTYVYLPSSTMSMEVSLAERRFVSMSGSMEIGLTLAGDISRVANLGDAPMSWGFAPSGTLYRGVPFGPQLMSVGATLTGVMSSLTLIPSGAVSMSYDVTGTLIRTGGLAGSVDLANTLSGDPYAIRYFGDQSISAGMGLTGALTKIQYLSGTVATAMDLVGSLSVGQVSLLPSSTLSMTAVLAGSLRGTFRMPGAIDMALDMSGQLMRLVAIGSQTLPMTTSLSGSLSSNATQADIDTNTMVRPYRERTMVRRS